MRICIKNLRHSFLQSNVLNKDQQLYIYNVHSKGDMDIQKIKVKKYIFVYSYPYLLNPDVYFHMIYIIRKASCSMVYVLIYMHITTESIIH